MDEVYEWPIEKNNFIFVIIDFCEIQDHFNFILFFFLLTKYTMHYKENKYFLLFPSPRNSDL